VLEDPRQRAKAQTPMMGRGDEIAEAQRRQLFAAANLKAFDNLPTVAAEFSAVAQAYPTVAAEAQVHIGYLALRAGRPEVALPPLGAAAESPDPHVRYLADYFRGRALERSGKRDEAIAAYRRALGTVAGAPSAATLLAAQLFVSGDAEQRSAAHALLESSAAARVLRDPWDSYWYGDARLRPVYMERLRQALRQ
jgi:tetratricopeptide (TPR) repeat protein